ncbi:MAG: phospholipid/cholesterol/gamma-HCH transport system substrate-binding protein [Pseudonocardiales bacterium]|nr:phospholipid/cholesterol/gamma-HCH transport system substrate-binding protein [Pseudonocardiales bacterium]
MKAMHERNQVSVAIWGTLIAAALVLTSINLDTLPFVNSTTTFYADFANAAGLKSSDDVRVEGISVGRVESVRVEGDHVHVAFTLQSGIKIGAASAATIEVATVLGNLFLQVESAGPGTMHAGATIPVSRTTVPYSLLGALNAFGNFSRRTDLPTLQESLKTLAQTISGVAPKDVTAALRGLSDVSSTLARKQNEITSILSSTEAIVKTLNANSGALVGLLTQGDQFLRLVEQRHELISQLLRDTARLGSQLSQLIGRNGTQVHALLANLDAVSSVLAKEKAQLQSAVVNLGQFSLNIANVGGAGPWLDLLSPTVVVPDNQIVACGKNPAAESKPCGK